MIYNSVLSLSPNLLPLAIDSMHSHISSNHLKFLSLLSSIALIVFGLFILSAENRSRYSAENDTEHYGELFSSYLWNIDDETAHEHATIIASEGKFLSISIIHPDNSPFVEYTNTAKNGQMRELFRSTKLIRNIVTTRPILYRNQLIGSITTERENSNIYTYIYLFLTLLLLVLSLTLVRVGRSNKEHQKNLEHDLSENRERFQTVVSASPVIVFSLDRKGKFTVCEGMGLNKLQAPPLDIIGKSIEEVHSEMPANTADFLRALKGESFSEIRTIEDRSFETWYSPTRDDDDIVGVIGVSTDVTAAIHAMNSLGEYKKSQATDLKIAQMAQRAFLPTNPPQLDGFEIGLLTKPSATIGGDYIHFDSCPNQQSLAVTFAEVSGHGVSTSLLTSIFHTQLVECLDRSTESISAAFYEINRRTYDLFPEGRFTSTFHTFIDAESSSLRYVKAAREPAILYSNDGAAEVINKGGPALGLLPNELLNEDSFTEHSLTLHSGDTLLLYSAGLVAVENLAGKSLNRKDIIQWVQDDINLSPQAIVESIFRKVVSHSAGEEIMDDVSVLVIRKS